MTPKHISDIAKLCLQALAAQGLGDTISLGGAFGLLHYLDYRPTFDVDAWWSSDFSTAQQELVIKTIEATLQPLGQVRQRRWGEVISLELTTDQKKVFSFQIAHRSIQLQPSVTAPWIAVQLDSFPDLIASKMVALVERGAPRDFRDIYAVCQAGLTQPIECWAWWRERQTKAQSDSDPQRARLAIETHLERIIQHRPLSQVADPHQKAAAEQLRTWFMKEFLHALSN